MIKDLSRNTQMTTTSTNIKTIDINGTLFRIDTRYEYVMDLASEELKKQVFVIDQLFGRSNDMVKVLIDQMIKEGCTKDIPTTYYLTMALQNFGQMKKAEKIIQKLYKDNPHDLLARCAYANSLLFARKYNEIPAVFHNSFDFDKAYLHPENDVPLVLFIHFMDIAFSYYFLKGDQRCLKYLTYLIKVAPEHETTQRLMARIMESMQGMQGDDYEPK